MFAPHHVQDSLLNRISKSHLPKFVTCNMHKESWTRQQRYRVGPHLYQGCMQDMRSSGTMQKRLLRHMQTAVM